MYVCMYMIWQVLCAFWEEGGRGDKRQKVQYSSSCSNNSGIVVAVVVVVVVVQYLL